MPQGRKPVTTYLTVMGNESNVYEKVRTEIAAGHQAYFVYPRIEENTEDYIERIVGKRSGVSYSNLLTEFRKTFLNIDAMVIEELKDLFFGLWE